MTALAQPKELSATSTAILTTLQDCGDWLSSREIIAALPTIEDLSPWQVGGLLKEMREQGLVENKAERNYNLWRVKPANGEQPKQGWRITPKPVPPAPTHPWKGAIKQGWRLTPKPVPPAPTHPWKGAIVDDHQRKLVACVLPLHLTSQIRESDHCPSSLMAAEADESAEIDPARLGLPEAVMTEESIEDEPLPAQPMPSQSYLDQVLADEDQSQKGQSHHGCTGQCQHAKQTDKLGEIWRLYAKADAEAGRLIDSRAKTRELYLRLLLTIADEAAATGEQLKDWPIWHHARAMAPHFNLETCYA